MTVICYKTKNKFFHRDTFLAYYTYKTVAEAQVEAEELNSTKPARLWNDKPVNWENVEYFFVSEQEEM